MRSRLCRVFETLPYVGARAPLPMNAYRQWLVASVQVGGCSLSVATKPGVLAHGTTDVAAFMLAEAVARRGVAGAPCHSVHLHSGNGLVAAVAGQAGYAVQAYDRYLPNVEATRRTLEASGGAAPRVAHGVLATADMPSGGADLVTIRIPTDRLGVQMAIAEAYRCLAVGGVCLLAGGNDEGVKPAARWLERVFGGVRLDAQHSGHRLLSAVRRAGEPADPAALASPWMNPDHMRATSVSLGAGEFTQYSRPGVFSWEHLDEATAMLAETARIAPGESVLDLGAGGGALGVVAARATQTGRVLLLDADADAVRCAARTVIGAGVHHVEVRASDAGEAVGDARFDVVVTNPPFHVGKATDLAVPRAFIEDSHAHLVPGGRLYLVANRTLPYERWISDCFGTVRTVHDGRRFKVLGATR